MLMTVPVINFVNSHQSYLRDPGSNSLVYGQARLAYSSLYEDLILTGTGVGAPDTRSGRKYDPDAFQTYNHPSDSNSNHFNTMFRDERCWRTNYLHVESQNSSYFVPLTDGPPDIPAAILNSSPYANNDRRQAALNQVAYLHGRVGGDPGSLVRIGSTMFAATGLQSDQLDPGTYFNFNDVVFVLQQGDPWDHGKPWTYYPERDGAEEPFGVRCPYSQSNGALGVDAPAEDLIPAVKAYYQALLDGTLSCASPAQSSTASP